MKKLRIVLALIRYLYCEKHVRGVKYTINRKVLGQKWFQVEPETVLVHETDVPAILQDIYGNKYVEVGGGSESGKIVFIGSGPTTSEDREPNAE